MGVFPCGPIQGHCTVSPTRPGEGYGGMLWAVAGVGPELTCRLRFDQDH